MEIPTRDSDTDLDLRNANWTYGEVSLIRIFVFDYRRRKPFVMVGDDLKSASRYRKRGKNLTHRKEE